MRDMGQRELNGSRPLAALTDKQREVLDLLLEHKTSKQIARQLRISPHTVDQRIQFAKDKLGARTRSEAAVAYRRLIETCEQMTYEESGIAPAAPEVNVASGAEVAVPRVPKPSPWTRNRSDRPHTAGADFRPLPGLFDGPYGTLVRLGAIIVIAVLLVLLVLGALATLTQLSELMA